MKNSLARQILAETPAETRQFVRRYGELSVRIANLLQEKGWTQKELAEKLGKSPSEISKWLSGEHNFTLRSLTKLEVELDEDLIQIPNTGKFRLHSSKVIHLHSSPPNDSVSAEKNVYIKLDFKNNAAIKSSVA